MNNKKFVIFIVILLISGVFIPVVNSVKYNYKSYDNNDEKTQIVQVYIKKYDAFGKTCCNELIKKITIDDAECIKNELLNIQKKFNSNEEVIRHQFDVMHKWELLDSKIDFDDFEQLLISRYNKNITVDIPMISTDVTILGPSIVSFLTIGSVIFPLHLLFWDMLGPLWWNATILNFDKLGGTSISAQVLLTPALAIYSSAMTFINSLGLVIGPKFMLSPFTSILIGVAGVSIAANIFTDSFAMNVFDWSAGFCLAGLIAYISQIEP